jgi:hypothetical protein
VTELASYGVTPQGFARRGLFPWLVPAADVHAIDLLTIREPKLVIRTTTGQTRRMPLRGVARSRLAELYPEIAAHAAAANPVVGGTRGRVIAWIAVALAVAGFAAVVWYSMRVA